MMQLKTAKLPRNFLRLKLAILFLTAPRLLDLLKGSSSSFGNNLPDVDEARKREGAIDRERSPQTQHVYQREKSERHHECSTPQRRCSDRGRTASHFGGENL